MIYTFVNRLGEIDWAALAPGDTVQIPWRPEPYREFVALSAVGTPEAPVRVVGVPGPNGERPVISGTKAVADAQFASFPDYTTFQPLALVLVHSGYGRPAPAFVEITGLVIEGATIDQADPSITRPDGTPGSWSEAATGLYLSKFDHVTVRDCEVRDCGTGIFTSDVRPCSDLLIENCKAWNCGKIGTNKRHCLYLQCVRPVVRGCDIGPTRPGSGGTAIKDRSADVLIAGNRITGGSIQVDLSAWQGEAAQRAAAPNANRVILCNNVLVNEAGNGHVGYVEGARGDQLELVCERNTAVVRRDKSEQYYTRFWRTEYATTRPVVRMDRNLLDFGPATPDGTPTQFRPLDAFGDLVWGDNWSRTAPAAPPAGVTVTGAAPAAAGVAPGYRDEAAGDYRLAEGAPAAGYGADVSVPPTPSPDPVPVPDPDPEPQPEPVPVPDYALVSEAVQTVGDARVTVRIERKV